MSPGAAYPSGRTRLKRRSKEISPQASMICRLLILLLGFVPPVWADDVGFFIRRAEWQTVNGRPVVNADIAYQFSTTAIEALMNGVPLTLSVTFSIIHPQRLWPDKPLLEEARDIQIRYLPLAESYQILDKSSGASQSFASLSTLLDTLSRLRNWLVPPPARSFKVGERYQARLRVNLDIESLPLPLRVQAYISSNWHHQSPAYEWPVNP